MGDMDTNGDTQQQELLPILWTLVMLQGGFALLLAIASVVAFGLSGPGAIVPFALTISATVVTFLAARGLRRQRRWARRVTIWAEWYLIVFAVLDTAFTLILTASLPPIIPLLSGLVIPIVVLRLLRLTKPLFNKQSEARADTHEESVEPLLDALI